MNDQPGLDITDITDKKTSSMEILDPIMSVDVNGEFASIARAKANLPTEEDNKIQPIGLDDELHEDDYNTAIKIARERLVELDAYNMEKNLKKDRLLIPKQKFCVVCWIGPTFKAKTSINGFRLMGCFASEYLANIYAKKVNLLEPMYDVGIMEMNLWCLGYPSSDDKSQEELDKKLNDFIVEHKVSIEESKSIFEIRKKAIRKSMRTTGLNIEDAPYESIPKGETTQEMEETHLKETVKWNNSKKQTKSIEKSNVIIEDFNSKTDLNHVCNVKMPEQEFAIVSYVGNTGANKRIPICIKGIFSTKDEAKKHIDKLIQFDDTYNLIPTPLYKWIPCDPDISQIKVIYKNKQLNKMLEADENQKEESMNFHQKVLNGDDLEEPINPNYEGNGSNPMEDLSEIISATRLLEQISTDIPTKSYNEVAETEEEEFSPNFTSLEDNIKELGISLQKLMDGGMSEEDAKNTLRVVGSVENNFKNFEEEEEEEEFVRSGTPAVSCQEIFTEENLDKISSMISSGLTNKEIRDLLNKQ
jgi:hypothetical protein